MSNTLNFVRRALRGGTALQALALLGAGAGVGAVALPAAAQDFTNGALVGSVQDEAGAPVAGATVTVRSAAQGFTRTATTNGNGSFRIQALPGGGYTVVITDASGAQIITQQVSISPGNNNAYTFRAGPAAAATGGDVTEAADAGSGSSAGDIVVTGQAERVNDFASNTGGLTIGNVTELLNTTPVARNQTALILLAPGTAAGDTAFGNLPSIAGATVAENQYYVNGLNVTNFRNFVGSNNPPIEFYQSFDTKTFGQSAEFGRSLGGFTATTTKSGSNTFKAGMLFAYSPDELRDDVPNTYADFNQNDRVEDIEANFYLSGPLIKDRLFFYALYNPNYTVSANSGITSGQRITTTNKSPFFGGKLDFIIADGHRLEGTYFRNRSVSYSNYDSFNATTQVIGSRIGQTRSQSGGDNFVGTYTGQFTNWLTLSGSYGENHDDQSFAPVPAVSYVSSTLTGRGTVAQGFTTGNSVDSDTRKFFRGDADVYVNLLGTHHFRGGYEQERLTSFTDTTYPGAYRYQFTPNYINRWLYQNTGTFKSKNEAYYIQDSWSLLNERINLQLGLRNDRFNNRALDGTTFNKSGNQWGPRLGASLDVFGDKRTRLFGSWSRYFLPVATNTNIRLGGAELYYQQRFAYPAGVNPRVFDSTGLPSGVQFDANGNVVGLTTTTSVVSGSCPAVSPDAGSNCAAVFSNGVQGATDTLVSSTLQPSYTDEWVVGAEQRFGDWQVSLTYVNRRLGRTLDDLAIDAAVNAYCDRNGISGCGDVWTGFHQYVLANPNTDITVRLDGDCETDARQCQVATLTAADLGFPSASRKYDSVQLAFSKAYRNRWGLSGSYTYTKLRGNYEGAVKSDNGQDDAGLTQDFDQPGLLDGAVGVLPNQRAHSFKLFGSVEPVDGFRFGANLLFESPRKFSCIGFYPDADNYAYDYGAASYYCTQPRFSGRPSFTNNLGGTSYLVNRGSAFKSDWRKQIDVNVQYDIAAFPGSYVSVDVFNVFNFKSKLDFQEFGDVADNQANVNYGQVTGYQQPRYVRFSLGLRFGESARR